MITIQEELNELFFDDTQIIEEMKLMDKNSVKKIKDKLEATIKSKNAKRLDKLLKIVPSKSFSDIKMMLKKRVIKDKQKFEKNYKIANRKINRVKNKDAKEALSLAAATAATIKDIPVEQIIEDHQRVFDPKNLIMLLAGLLVIFKDIMAFSQGYTFANPVMGYAILTIASLIVIKTSYNLIAGREAQSLFIII